MVTSLAAIAAASIVVGCLKIKISMSRSCVGSWTRRRCLAGAEKWPKTVAAVAEDDFENTVAGDYCGGFDGNSEY